jgi:hypothetical protein
MLHRPRTREEANHWPTPAGEREKKQPTGLHQRENAKRRNKPLAKTSGKKLKRNTSDALADEQTEGIC